MTPENLAALIILVLTYVGVAAGRIPGLRLDRAGIAFLGGAAMIAVGPLSLAEAFRAIDMSKVRVEGAMMIVEFTIPTVEGQSGVHVKTFDFSADAPEMRTVPHPLLELG